MERVNSLCRILAISAITLLIAVFGFDSLPQSESAKLAEDTLHKQIYEIQTALNEDLKDEIILFETGSLNKNYTTEQLDPLVSDWLTKVSKGRTYSDGMVQQVKAEIIALYHKQKEIASDPLRSLVSDWIVKGSTLILILCNLNIVFVFRKQRKNAKQLKSIALTEARSISKDPSRDEVNEFVETDNQAVSE
ncbi:hypothetical protein D5266_09080 [bacterium c-19]|nr:hypothetical protein [bacterium c-19]